MSGMASRIIQLYLTEILNCFLHPDSTVRLWAVRVVQIVLRQGLVHPVRMVPYLICLSTDEKTDVSMKSTMRNRTNPSKEYHLIVCISLNTPTGCPSCRFASQRHWSNVFGLCQYESPSGLTPFLCASRNSANAWRESHRSRLYVCYHFSSKRITK